MAKMKGWEIFLIILGIIQIIQVVGVYTNRVAETQGQGTGLIQLGVIAYLLFRNYEVRDPSQHTKKEKRT